MKLNELLNIKACICSAVPLAIANTGFAYLNDYGMWNVTLNSTHADVEAAYTTVKQVLDLFKNYSRCKNNIIQYEHDLPIFIKLLESMDQNTKLDYN